MRAGALLAAGLLAVAAGAGSEARGEDPPSIPGEWVVVQAAVPARQALAGPGTGTAPSLAEAGYRNVPVPPGISREDFLAALRREPGVLSAEPSAEVLAAAIPNDPYYGPEQSSYLASIGAPAGWDYATGGNGTVVVAVLDSGLDLGHEDFAGRLWENLADADNDGIDDDGNGCVDDRYGCRFINLTADRASGCGYTDSRATGAVLDDNGLAGAANHSHGTMVAGIIGAAGNNGRGIAGVAWNTRIMTVKVLDCGTASHGGSPGGDMANVAQGIDYARRMGAQVISLSLASRPGDQSADIAILRDAIQAAQDQGVIIVAAAGNRGLDPSQVGPGYPAAYTQYPNLLAVGAADNTNGNAWASYSTYGPAIDFAAPGTGIVSTVRSDLGVPLYGRAERGTSFAAPLVAGAFAVLISRNTGLAAADYIQAARDTATPPQPAPHGQNWAGSGIINAGAAAARIPMTITGAAMHDWKDIGGSVEMRATIDGAECGRTNTFVFGPVTRYSLRVKTAAEAAGCGVPGRQVKFTLGGVAAVPTITWGEQNADLAVRNLEVSTVTPPPGAIVIQPLGPGWNQVVHLEPAATLPGALSYLPGNWSAALRWEPTAQGLESRGRYLHAGRTTPAYVNDWKIANRYDVFWVDVSAAALAMLNPNPPPGRIQVLERGWNVFVYTGSSKPVSDALSEVAGRYSQVLRYDNLQGTWSSHLPGQPRYLNDFGAMLHLQIYWVLATADGFITMD